MHRSIVILLVGMLGCASGRPVDPSGLGGPLPAGDPDRGRVLGRKYCTSCHGLEGDGRGEAAAGLEREPRSFVRAVYRYRSTPSGSLPTDRDLARSIARGLPGTSMAGFGAFLTRRELMDLVAWVKSFSDRFEMEEVDPPVEIPPPPKTTPALVAQGKALYLELECDKCHGALGRGDGTASDEELQDNLGRVVRPRDFTDGLYRGGGRAEDLYRTFVTGLDGSPMPAYEDTLAPEEVYAVVAYLRELERDPSPWRWLVRAPRWWDGLTDREARR